MKVTVRKWGKTLALRIPNDVAVKAALVNGASVELKVTHRSVTIQKPRVRKKLKKLVTGIDSKKRHAEIDWPLPPTGKKMDLKRMRSVLGRGKHALRGKSVEEWMDWLRGPVELP